MQFWGGKVGNLLKKTEKITATRTMITTHAYDAANRRVQEIQDASVNG